MEGLQGLFFTQNADKLHPGFALFTLLLFALFFFSIGSHKHLKTSKRKLRDLPPGNTGLPFFGNTFVHIKWYHKYDEQDMYRSSLLSYGPIWKTHVFSFPACVVSGAAAVRKVLNAEFDSMASAYPPSIKNVLGQHALLFLPKDKHKAARGILMRAFVPAAVESYIPAIERLARSMVATWASGEGPWGKGTVVWADAAQEFTFEVAKEVILGLEMDEAKTEWTRNMFKVFREGTGSLFALMIPGTRYYRGMRARAALLEMLREQVARLRASKGGAAGGAGSDTASDTAAPPVGRPNAMTLLLGMKDEEGNELSEEELLDQLLLILFAGHDTSSSTLSVALLCLGLHPEAYARMQAEQDRVVAAHGEALSAAALSDMSYTEAVIKETLRIRPVVPNLIRRAACDVRLAGYVIPRGHLCLASIRATHYWDKAVGGMGGLAEGLDHMSLERGFKPERWLDAATRPEAWFPFGHGPRLCLGMNLAMTEMKALLAILARSCDLSLMDKSPEFKWSPFPAPKSGVPLALVRHKNE